MSLCRAYSAPAIRSKLAPDCMRDPQAPFLGEAWGPTDLSYALRPCIAYMHFRMHCAAALQTPISCSPGLGHHPSLAELGHWRAAACAGCWNGDGLLVQHSIGNDHAVGNDE